MVGQWWDREVRMWAVHEVGVWVGGGQAVAQMRRVVGGRGGVRQCGADWRRRLPGVQALAGHFLGTVQAVRLLAIVPGKGAEELNARGAREERRAGKGHSYGQVESRQEGRSTHIRELSPADVKPGTSGIERA